MCYKHGKSYTDSILGKGPSIAPRVLATVRNLRALCLGRGGFGGGSPLISMITNTGGMGVGHWRLQFLASM